MNARNATAYVRRQLPWLALPLAPAQGVWVTRRVPRLSEAEGREGVVGEGDRHLRVVGVGDSVTAGYAVAHHRSTVVGRLAALVAQRYAARVTWGVCAKSGSTAGTALALLDPAALADADLVFLSIGVNDAKNGHSTARFRREVGALFDALLEVAPRASVCLLGGAAP